MKKTFSDTIYFSYNQFLVFDKSITLPGKAWTEEDFNRGFTHNRGHAAFRTLLEFGDGELNVYTDSYQALNPDEMVIELPFEVLSGEVLVAGPEEFEDQRMVRIDQGEYRLTVAQTVIDDGRERIDLFFDKVTESTCLSG